MSALMLSSLPIGVFFVIHFISPDFYGSVWQFDLTKMVLAGAVSWMLLGNFAMYRLVNFRI
jgi:tight adherence protein B